MIFTAFHRHFLHYLDMISAVKRNSADVSLNFSAYSCFFFLFCVALLIQTYNGMPSHINDISQFSKKPLFPYISLITALLVVSLYATRKPSFIALSQQTSISLLKTILKKRQIGKEQAKDFLRLGSLTQQQVTHKFVKLTCYHV